MLEPKHKIILFNRKVPAGLRFLLSREHVLLLLLDQFDNMMIYDGLLVRVRLVEVFLLIVKRGLEKLLVHLKRATRLRFRVNCPHLKLLLHLLMLYTDDLRVFSITRIPLSFSLIFRQRCLLLRGSLEWSLLRG